MILVNGHPSEHVAVTDRGLAYGDGVFETIAFVDGKARHWERHMTRLSEGCERLGIRPPDASELTAEIETLPARSGNSILKIIVTRGVGGRGYRPGAGAEPTRIISLSDWPEHPPSWAAEGVDVWLCETRLGHNPALAGIKHLNRLEQVLASREWPDERYAEGLMLDESGLVIEGTRTNVFMVSAGRVLTPDLKQCGVAGIMRAVIFDVFSRLGTDVQRCQISVADVLTADELFLSNSIIGLWPVRCLSHRQTKRYDLGPITLALQDHLRKRGDIL